MNIYKKLCLVQEELKAPKHQYNKFGKFNYRSYEDILEALKPLLIKNSLLMTLHDEAVQIGDRIYIMAVPEIINLDTPEEKISGSAYAREAEKLKGMSESQITGTASSYARKYALNGLFLIDDSEDTDHVENPLNQKEIDLMTKEQSDLFIRLCEKEKLDPKEVAKEYNITKTMKHDAFDITFKIIKTHIKSGDIGFDLTKGVKV